MKIDSDDKSVAEVLGGGYYTIPRFQRQYSWSRENVEDFLRDVVEEPTADYFIGSIVVFKDAGSFGVVDGQQRLTTITMLLAALRNKFSELELSSLAEGVHGLIERADIKNVKNYVLQPQSSYPYFHNHIQAFSAPSTAPTISPEEQALAGAFHLITDTVTQSVDAILDDATLSEDTRDERARVRLEEIRDKALEEAPCTGVP